MAAAVLSGLSTASNGVLVKKISYTPTYSTIFLWITSAIANFFMALLLDEKIPSLEFRMQWMYLVFFSIASIFASYTFVKGVKLIDAGVAGILGLLEIVFGVLFGYVFFGERIEWIVLCGLLIILISAAIPYLQEYKTKRNIV